MISDFSVGLSVYRGYAVDGYRLQTFLKNSDQLSPTVAGLEHTLWAYDISWVVLLTGGAATFLVHLVSGASRGSHWKALLEFFSWPVQTISRCFLRYVYKSVMLKAAKK